MSDTIRTKIKKTKDFVKRHPTSVACAATAVVTWKLTRDSTVKGLLTDATELAYEWGAKTGQLEMLLDESYNFIKERGLEPEFVDFANMRVA